MNIEKLIEKLEKLLSEDKEKEALELVKKEAKGKEDDVALIHFDFARKIAKNEELKKLATKFIAITYYNWGNSHYRLAEIETNLKKKKELLNKACKKYEKATKIDKNLAKAYSNWGNSISDLAEIERDLEEKRKLLNDSCKKYEKATKIDKNLAEAYSNWGNSISKLAEIERDLEEKRKLLNDSCKKYEKATKIDKNLAKAYSNWGNSISDLAEIERDLEEKRKLLKESCKKYEGAIDIDENHAKAQANLGILLFKLGEFKRAREKFKIAREKFHEKGMDFDSKKMKGFEFWAEAIILLKKNPEESKKIYVKSSEVFEEIENKNLAEYLRTRSEYISIDIKFKNIVSLKSIRQMKIEMNKLIKESEKIKFAQENPDTIIFGAKNICFNVFNEILEKMDKIRVGEILNFNGAKRNLNQAKQIFDSLGYNEELNYIKELENKINLLENEGILIEKKFIQKSEILDGKVSDESEEKTYEKHSEPYKMTKKELREMVREELRESTKKITNHFDKKTEEVKTEIHLSKNEIIFQIQEKHHDLLEKIEKLNKSQFKKLRELIFKEVENEIEKTENEKQKEEKRDRWHTIKKSIKFGAETLNVLASIIEIYSFVRMGQTEQAFDNAIFMIRRCLEKVK